MALRSGKWTPEEDEILTRFILTNGGMCKKGWNSLAKKAGLERSGKSCRMRWLNYLRPDIKRGAFTSEEDDLILRLHTLLGNRWSLIAGRIPGRTDNEIKNYWNAHLNKKAKETASVRSQNVSSSSGDHENVKSNLSCSRDSSFTEEKETDGISEEEAKAGCPLKLTATKGTVQSRTINTVFSSEQTEAVDSKESEAAYYPDLQMSIQELLWAPHSCHFPEFDFLTQVDDSIFL